jgi:hypothetical protein
MVPSVGLLKLCADILGTGGLLWRHDCLYPLISGSLAEPKRLEPGNARDSRIPDTVGP